MFLLRLFQYDHFVDTRRYMVNSFQLSVAFHIATSHLIYTANQMTGFYMKCNTAKVSLCKQDTDFFVFN